MPYFFSSFHLRRFKGTDNWQEICDLDPGENEKFTNYSDRLKLVF